jgi:hypothetical protein
VDVRYKRLLLTYSHGAGLDVSSLANATEKAAGMVIREPWTTGGGVGAILVDELWVLADLKAHHFEALPEAARLWSRGWEDRRKPAWQPRPNPCTAEACVSAASFVAPRRPALASPP